MPPMPRRISRSRSCIPSGYLRLCTCRHRKVKQSRRFFLSGPPQPPWVPRLHVPMAAGRCLSRQWNESIVAVGGAGDRSYLRVFQPDGAGQGTGPRTDSAGLRLRLQAVNAQRCQSPLQAPASSGRITEEEREHEARIGRTRSAGSACGTASSPAEAARTAHTLLAADAAWRMHGGTEQIHPGCLLQHSGPVHRVPTRRESR